MYLAIDVGGTKTLLAIFDEQGVIVEQSKFPTNADYLTFVSELANNVANLSTKEFKVCCVAAPGLIEYETGVVIAFGNLPWKNVPLVDDVKQITNSRVLIENDVKLAGLSEALLLSPPVQKVLYVTVSTGISDGLIVDNKIDRNLHDSEAGHMLLEHEGKLQTWQSIASGKAIVAKYGKKASEINDEQTWKEITHNLAIGLQNVIANVQPDIVIIGGGVGTHFQKFGDFLNAELATYSLDMVPIPKVVGAKRPEEAVVYGCYELAKSYNT